MRRWLYVALVAATGCGRFGFGDSSHPADAHGDAIGDGGDAGPSVLRAAYVKAMNTEAFDQFGSVVAVSANGSTIAVGAPAEDGGVPGINASDGSSNSVGESGAVYVFVRSGTTWQQQAFIKASTLDANDGFGEMLALSGDGNTLAVGVPNEDSGATTINGNQADDAATDAGAVFVFVRSGTTWTQQAYIKANNAELGDQFGWSVALSSTGDYLAVGAQAEDSAATGVNGNGASNATLDSGAAYVFTRSGTTWSQQAYVKAWNPGATDAFGFSVAIAGDGATLAVSASGEDNSLAGVHAGAGPFADDNTISEAGAAYVFTRSGTTWSQQAYIKPSFVGFGGDYFGRPLAMSAGGDVLACGSPGSDTMVANSGAVWVFRRTGSTWAEEKELKASNAGDNDQLGASVTVAPDGTEILAGSIYEDSNASGLDGDQTDNSSIDSGAVYLFDFSTSWSQRAYIKGRAPSAGDQLGNSLGLSADHQTHAIAAVYEDSAATGIDGNANDESAPDSGAIEISFY